jgi:NADH:ubiquinone reductase (H+-translocating)
LAGFRNRLSVLLEWGYSFFTFERGARLITADPPRTDGSAPGVAPHGPESVSS